MYRNIIFLLKMMVVHLGRVAPIGEPFGMSGIKDGAVGE
jgi:hypothetical protein